MKTKIAYIDDDVMNLECIQLIFEDEYEMQTFSDPEKFLINFAEIRYDCILLDIHMPILDGFELYEKIISAPHYNGCPILFISSDESDQAKIRSLTLGAVDFMGRLTGADEMIARVKSKIQFFQKHRSLVEFDGLKINLTLLKASLEGQELPLTFLELKILLLVLRAFPEAVSKEALVQNAWKGAHVQDATIYTHVFNLNQKLGDWLYEVQTVKNKGTQLVRKP